MATCDLEDSLKLVSFAVDPNDPAIVEHNRQAREVWEAYEADRPIRVPVAFSSAWTVYSDENDVDHVRYYEDPDEMLRVQLGWAKRTRELPFGDNVLLGELPETWNVQVEFHPALIPACFGCPVLFRPDAVPAHHGLKLSREECRNLAMPDLEKSGLLPRYRSFWEHINRRCAGGLSFMGRPVELNNCAPGGGNGLFSLALDIRGEGLMADMYEDPEFVHSFLGRLANWMIDLQRRWASLGGYEFWMDEAGGPGWGPSDHGIDMLSGKTFETFLVPLIQDMNARCHKTVPPILHHCGHGAHLFPIVKKHFGLEHLDALTFPLLDIGKIRKELGYDIWITAHLNQEIFALGPPDKIRQAVKEFLTPEVKGKGRLCILSIGETRHIPAEHFAALYEAVKEYGQY